MSHHGGWNEVVHGAVRESEDRDAGRERAGQDPDALPDGDPVSESEVAGGDECADQARLQSPVRRASEALFVPEVGIRDWLFREAGPLPGGRE